jgi:hypothetical protein
MFGAARVVHLRLHVASAVLLACMLHATLVLAQTGATAEQLFRDGRAAMLAGKLEDARLKLEASATLDPAAGTLLNLAECNEKLGRTATAVALYLRAREAAIKRERTEWASAASARILALGPSLPQLRIAGVRNSAAEIYLDGVRIFTKSAAELTPVDPGPHTLLLSINGKETFRREFTAREAAIEEVVVPAESIPVSAGFVPALPAARPAAGGGSALPWVLAAGSGLALGTAGVLTLVRNGQINKMQEANCSGTLSRINFGKCEELKTGVMSATPAVIALVGAGVLAVAAVTVYFATQPAASRQVARVLCVPELTGGSCIVQF